MEKTTEDIFYGSDVDSDIEFNAFIEETKKMKKEPENKKELILKYLKYLGLNKFNLTSIDNIRMQVREMIIHEDINYCGIFNSHVNDDGSVDERHMRLFVKENGMFNIVNFTLVRDLTNEGYWNKIQLYKDTHNKPMLHT